MNSSVSPIPLQNKPRYGKLRQCHQFIHQGPPRGSKWIISVGDYADNSFAALGSSDSREVILELQPGFYVFHFRFVQVHFVLC